MAIKKRTSAQAAKDKAALKRLQKSGYKGRIDLRKAPTKYQLSKIKVLREKRARRPLPPKQKATGGARVKRTRMTEKEVRALKPNDNFALTTYALPFLRKGQQEPEWRRFTGPQLTKFLAEYKADDPDGAAEWRSYAVKETWTFPTKTDRKVFRSETNLYFSGVRVDGPKGKIKKRMSNKKR